MNEEQLRQIHQAYLSGVMNAQESADFEADVNSGELALPQGLTLRADEKQPNVTNTATNIPSGVIEAYLDGRMDEQSKLQLEDDVQSGAIVLPQNIKTTPYLRPQQAPGKESLKLSQDPTFNEQMLGVGETALTLGTGATAGTAGMIAGTLKGLAEQIASGKYGTQEGARLIQETADKFAQAGTYEPKTETGKGMVQAVGETLAPLEAIAPIGAELGALAKIQKPRIPKPSAKAALVQEVEATGIKPVTSDIFPPKTFIGKFAQATGEKIPFAGTGGKRAAQQGQRIEAVREMLREFGAIEAADATDDVMRNLLTKRGKDVTKYSKLKGDVISKLGEVGEVPIAKTIGTIDNEIAMLKGLKTQNVQPAIALLDDFKASLQGQNLTNVELLRKQLGAQFKSPDYASVRSTADKSINKIYGSLKEDMGDFIKTHGERKDVTKWEVANKRLSNMMGDLKNSTLKSTLAKGEATPELVKRMLFSQKPSEMKTLYKNLTPEGRKNAQSAILHEAYRKAGGAESMTPEKFMSNLKRLEKSSGVFFKGNDLKKIQGLEKALRVTRRAGTSGVMTETGVQATPIIGAAVLTDFLGGAGGGIGGMATIGGLSRLYESRAVTNLLIKLGNAPKAKELPLTNALIMEIKNLQEEGKQNGE